MYSYPQHPLLFRSLLVLTCCAAALIPSAGCANKQKELEPRPNTRPMVNAIQQAEQDWGWISAEQWHLVTLEGKAPIAGTSMRIAFKQHTWLEGDAGCNRFTASYARKADSGLKITEILSTRMFCAQPDGVMQQESRFFHLLKRVDAYHAEPDRLDMLADGAIVLTFMALKPEESP